MASLTDQLSNPTAGKDIIATKVAQPSFITGLANFASGAMGAVSNFQTDQAQAKATSRAAGLRDALNEAEQATFDKMSEGVRTVDVRTDTVSVWDSEASKAVWELGKTQKAVDQGKAAAGAFDLQMERVKADLFWKFPEYKAEISNYMQSRGMEDYLFREQKQAAAFNDQVASSERAAFKTSYDYAVSNGVPPDPDDPSKTAAAGSQLMALEAQRKLAKEAYEFSRQQKTDARSEHDYNEKGYQQEIGQTFVQEANIKLGGVITSSASLIAAAGDDVKKQATVAQIASEVQPVFAAYRAARLAQITDKVAAEDFNKAMDRLEKSAVDLFTGPLSQYQTTMRAVNNMKNTFQLNEAQALPIYTELKGVLGAAGIAELFGGNMATALPPETMTALRHEFNGWKTADAREGQVLLNNVIQILRKEKTIGDLTEKEAIAQMPVLTKVFEGSLKDVITKGEDPISLDNFGTSYGNLLNAAIEINPGIDPTRNGSVLRASSLLASKDARRGIEAGMRTDPERFKTIAMGSRGTAVRLLEVSKTMKTKDGATTFHSVAYDPKSGRYWAKPDKAKYDKFMARQGTIPNMPWTALKDLPVPTDITQKIDSLNLNVNHLVETAKYDEGVPKGVTPLQLANHYAVGAPLVRTDAAGKPTTKSADEQFQTSVDATRNELRALPDRIITEMPTPKSTSFKGASISAGDAVSRLQSYDVPRHVAAGIVGNLMAESGLRTGAVSTTTKGRKDIGLAQWEPERRKEAAKFRFDLNDPNDAIDFILHELKNKESTAYTKLKGAKTSEEAARIFALYYLRPAGAQTGDSNKIHNMTGRIKYAQELG